MPSNNLPISADEKGYSLFAKELLGHIYCGNVAYQNRMISAYYHPVCVFLDQFVAVNGRKIIQDLQKLLHLYFGWFVSDVDVEITHVSASQDCQNVPIPCHNNNQNSSLSDSSPVVSPLDSNLTNIVMKRRGLTFIIDHSIHIRTLTPIGKVLRFLRILPPPTLLGYSPNNTLLPSVSPGLRVITKIKWITDIHAPMHPTAFNERGYIIYHENMYNPSKQSGYLLFHPFFWLSLFLSLVALVLQKLSSVIKFGLNKASAMTRNNHAKEASLDKAVQKLSLLWTIHVPDNFEHSLKHSLGWFLTQVLVPRLEKEDHHANHVRKRKLAPSGGGGGDIAKAG